MKDKSPLGPLRGIFWSLLAILALASPGHAQDAPASGWPALPALADEPLAAADLAEGATLLVVWASWSPRCRDIGARVERLAETWSNDARVASVVFQEDPETVREVVAESGLSAPVYLDLTGDFSKRHAVTTLPMLLIFRDGERVFRGKLAANPDPVIERALAAGE